MDKFNDDKRFSIPMVTGGKEDFLDKIERKSTSLSLKAKNNNLEVIHQIISKDKMFMIKSEEDAFEFYYILEGKIKNNETGEILIADNFISVQGEVEEAYFKTIEETKLLLLSNVPIFNGVEKRFNELIALNDKVLHKDQETKEHCTRLHELSLITAEKLGLKDKQLFTLGYASFLHDIGKIDINHEILTKPGSLTDEEWEEMKTHSLKGSNIILEYLKEGYFEDVARIVYQHHERYDGKGYPQGLKGDEIMIEAQILTVVDAYDAMTSERPSQERLSREYALKELKVCKGKQFSPEVVEAFLEAEDEYHKNNI